jgi:hypothetical protein
MISSTAKFFHFFWFFFYIVNLILIKIPNLLSVIIYFPGDHTVPPSTREKKIQRKELVATIKLDIKNKTIKLSWIFALNALVNFWQGKGILGNLEAAVIIRSVSLQLKYTFTKWSFKNKGGSELIPVSNTRFS